MATKTIKVDAGSCDHRVKALQERADKLKISAKIYPGKASKSIHIEATLEDLNRLFEKE